MQPTESAQPTPQTPQMLNPPSVPLAASETDQAEDAEKLARIAWFTSPEFTRKLLEHMHRAKIAALLESPQRREQ